MRITGGEARGRRLRSVSSALVRPSSGVIREAIFNILSGVRDKLFLDLFAGSGSVGLEALSRGAGEAVFVEKDASVAGELRKNITSLGYEGRSEVLTMEAGKAISLLNSRGRVFDIIFVDPPYEKKHLPEIMTVLAGDSAGTAGLLAREGILVFQHSGREEIEVPEVFTLWKARDYGGSRLTFLVRGDRFEICPQSQEG
ncbi:MAG: 16S rRNA (guanine(966)-N(2))-methyltransferase RsmD [Smithellaceae bacterium]|nr:16S rRNA (guanine(966)-N(2))-methyltransferase RsmD [Smithellaceae bacterium]